MLVRPYFWVALSARRLAWRDRGQVEEVADTGEGVGRGGASPVEVGGRVAEALGQLPPGLEVELVRGQSATSS